MTPLQSQFAIDLFPFYHLLVGSTDSKQTSKGLFIFQLSFERKNFFSAPFYHANGNQLGDEMKKNSCFPEEATVQDRQALISTSTPLGRSSLLNASTVREDEV